MASISPPSSLEDLDKDVELGKQRKPQLTQQQRDLLEASEPPFTEHVSPSSDPNDNDGGQLEKTTSAKPSLTNIRFVPNGGLRAWLQVLGSFFIYFNAWGIVNTFGTYQTYYETALLASSSPSQIAWIGSVQAFLLMVVSALGGPLYDAGFSLAQAVCVGVGTGAMFVPGVAILSTYFSTKIATATGLAAAGSSLGGTIYPIVFRQLQPRIGFPWATRVLGFMMLSTLVVSNCVLKVRVLPEGRRRFLDLTAFREAPYLFFVAGNMLAFLGLYNPFFYVPSYVIESGIAGPDLAFYMLSIINAASTFGRIIPGYTADPIGPLNMIVPCTFLAGVLCICLAAAHSVGPVIAILVLYGFCSGTLVSLPPTIFVHLTQDRRLIGTRLGMGFAMTSLGMLSGPPISGAILNKSSFTYVWVFGGVCTVAGSLCLLGTRVTKGGAGLMTKV
ncbi:hypothetical protein LTR29_011849 [Friedmanniomyces endolithicus]|nr:hypothetical protein LTR29_011849 [Friedmanniomyces endolithicus]